MKKKVIVVDDPKTCRCCPVFHIVTADRYMCDAVRKMFPESAHSLLAKSDNYKPAWCPMRDLPEPKLDWRSGENGYESGWNDLLDLIGGAE